ncbi:MAG: Cys-Gln thioester bond-forming surface protein [Proteobacteria bacterium]|nr:Cys-Gln thioester bond-forming surface protein [Pseudomonadota bacterium]MBU1452058.1 Cys-Gln thioester bond-forming surface protein [Pseudomonadota bacterium]MBU2468041.1 Cys-Gln thioester bond-forming surface protein [Pseudomonadota bacterium]MBU2518742.1 Cys-Gln thioester bond-forming surface protein [Pseudomonadota bacterium]
MKRIIAALLFCLLSLPAGALADTIGFKGYQIPGLKVEGYIGWHKVKADYVGEFNITWDEQEVLAAYCTDMLTFGVGGEYKVQALSAYDYETYSSLYQAAWIMENYSPSLSTVDDAYYTETATAVQAALWNLFDGWDLTKVKGSKQQSSYVTTLYYEILAEAAGVDFSTYTFKNEFHYATSDNRQDLLFATSGVGAPEPGSLLLMGSALAGAWGYMRRRKKALRA